MKRVQPIDSVQELNVFRLLRIARNLKVKDLAEALSDAVIDIYNNKKWHKIVVDEYRRIENLETETEFSLTDV